jgi:spermidine synthase
MTTHPAATISEHEGVRYLHLGTPWVQGAMRIRDPAYVELEYVRRMLVWLLWRPAEALPGSQAVQLGLGAAAITRFTRHTLDLDTTVVECNPSVISACRLLFGLDTADPRLAVVRADAGAWVAQPERAASADVLCVDLYDHEAAGPVLDDQVFYDHCARLLRPGGVMTVNLFGRRASFAVSVGRIAQAFGWHQVWQVQPTREGNTVVVAARGVQVPDAAALRARAAQVQARHGLPALRWLRMVRPATMPAA